MPKSRRPAHRSRCACTSSNSSHIFVHHVVECADIRNQSNSVQSNHQQVPSADKIAACILKQLRTNTSLPDKVAATTTLPGVIDFVQEAIKKCSTGINNLPLKILIGLISNSLQRVLILFSFQLKSNTIAFVPYDLLIFLA